MFRSQTHLTTRWLLLVLAGCALSAPAARSNDCPAILPQEASALGAWRLCEASTKSADSLTACRVYSDGRRIYELRFRGGTVPAAAIKRAGDPSARKEIAVRQRACDLDRPAGVPDAAIYRGTGVCRDDQNRPLPCSLFEHNGAREPEAKRYFVYYRPGGGGVQRIDTLSAGPNQSVLEAELAYQLGRMLDNTDCCRDQARAYLAYAAALFPADPTYRSGVQAPGPAPVLQVTTESGCTPDSASTLDNGTSRNSRPDNRETLP